MDDYADLLHATHRTDQAEYIKRCAESIKTGRCGSARSSDSRRRKRGSCLGFSLLRQHLRHPHRRLYLQSQPVLVVNDNKSAWPDHPVCHTIVSLLLLRFLHSRSNRLFSIKINRNRLRRLKLRRRPVVASSPQPSPVSGWKAEWCDQCLLLRNRMDLLPVLHRSRMPTSVSGSRATSQQPVCDQSICPASEGATACKYAARQCAHNPDDEKP